MIKLLILAFVFAATALDFEQAAAQGSDELLYEAEFGVQAYTFRHNTRENGIESTLDIVQEMGFTQFEGGPGGDMTPEEFRRLCEERGISIPSTGTGYEQLVENPEGVAERAKILGADYVMTAWIPHDVGNFNYENARQAVDDFNAAGRVLNEHGLTFKYHFHGYEIIPHEDGTLLDYIVQHTDPEYVSFQMDVFWIHFGGGDPVELLRKYPDRWVSMHLKDMETGTERDHTGLTDGDTNVPLGTGEIDIEEIVRVGHDLGIGYYFIEDESSDVMTQVPQSIEYLKSLRK